MNFQEFEKVVDESLDHAKKTLVIKNKEYYRNDNPLHNFEEGMRFSNASREQVIWGFALKHFISIQDIKKDLLNHEKLPTLEMLDEKYGDLINYLLIEKASIVDKIKNS